MLASSALLVSHVPVLRENIIRTTKWPEVRSCTPSIPTSRVTVSQVIAASRRLICDISEEEKRRELKDIADVYASFQFTSAPVVQ